MKPWEPAKLSWEGREYTIPGTKILGAIGAIEEVFTLVELSERLKTGSPPFAKIALAYGRVLRYAGAQITDEEVYEGLFADGDNAVSARDAMLGLLLLMTPPKLRTRKVEATNAISSGNVEPPSSKKPGKR